MEIVSNEDLSSEILLRLPPKSVLRFQLVSKLWLSIVSSPQFRRLHTFRRGANPSPTGLLFRFINHRRNRAEFDYVPLKSDNNHHHHKFSSFEYIIKGTNRELDYKSSCNGLLLFKSVDYNDSKYDGEYYVTNPTTKEFKLISIPPTKTNNYFLEYLAYDPSLSPHYNVVTVSFVENTNKLQIDVYSSENEFCSPERNTFSFDLDHHNTPPTVAMKEIFCNGIIHLLGLSWTDMLCIDLNKRCLIKCPLPRRSGRVLYTIKQSRGTIYLVVGICNEIDVHELKKDYSGWFLKYKFDLASIEIDCRRIKPDFPSLGLSIFIASNSILSSILCEEEEEEEEEGPTMVFVAFKQLVAYNLATKTTKIIGNVEPLYTGNYRSFSAVFPHFETLARV